MCPLRHCINTIWNRVLCTTRCGGAENQKPVDGSGSIFPNASWRFLLSLGQPLNDVMGAASPIGHKKLLDPKAVLTEGHFLDAAAAQVAAPGSGDRLKHHFGIVEQRGDVIITGRERNDPNAI